MKQSISVIGLGKLGLCYAMVLKSNGFNVVGYDIDETVVDCLKQKKAPYKEPQLQELMDSTQPITLATSIKQAIINTEITVLVLPTPSKDSGEFSNSFLEAALSDCAQVLADKKTYHLFSIISTVSPTSVEKVFIPLIEKISKKICNVDFGIAYNPSFIALGSVIKNITSPDFVLLGQSDETAGDRLVLIYDKILKHPVPIQRMSLVSAEITKIALNAFVTMKISFANFIQLITSQYAGADASDISKALGHDKRIGKACLTPGTPFGGPCFPRDNRCFAEFVTQIGLESSLAIATDNINLTVKKSLTEYALSEIKKTKVKHVIIYGMSYKPYTPICEESFSIYLVNHILNADKSINISFIDDYVELDTVEKELDKNIHKGRLAKVEHIQEIKKNDLVIFCHPIDEKPLAKVMKNSCRVINFWKL